MKKLPPLFLSLLSGLLLFAAWPVSAFTFLIFIALIPLLWLEEQCSSRGQFFLWSYLTLFIWNIGTTWWICEASVTGGLLAILLNPLLMSIPWIAFYNVKRRMGPYIGYTALVVFWLSFEYIHLNWELSWPWLTLGNAFATQVNWIQWYDITGVGGGSCWILLVNLALFQLLKKSLPVSKLNSQFLIVSTMLLFLPAAGSWIILTYAGSGNAPGLIHSKNIVIVQPNIDPYLKFDSGKEVLELQHILQLSQSAIDSETAILVWPETAIPVSTDEDSMKSSGFIAPVWNFLRAHPKINLISGIEGYRLFNEQQKTGLSAKLPGTNLYYEAYNSALLMDSDRFTIYHKSKFVPGVETIPSYLHFLEPLFDKFGGATGSYIKQENRTPLSAYTGIYIIAPAVCYESIYGEFMSAYIRKGANLIVIITDDGWWGNTPGYKQHENYARLRAIENRRWVVRSANTGISCFIDPYGQVLDQQEWNRTAAIKMNIPPLSKISFYTRWGDLIFNLAIAMTIVIFIWNITLLLVKRIRSKKIE
jgi:apolipoprotein N-acyltransferase